MPQNSDEDVTPTFNEVLIDKHEPWEYFCKECKQLRLWLKGGIPDQCGNCKSEQIMVDKPNSERLTKLRQEAKETWDDVF